MYFKEIPYEVLLNICLYIEKSDNLYDFLEILKKKGEFKNICKYIYNYYINVLEKYYNSINDEESLYYLEEFMTNKYDIEINIEKYEEMDNHGIYMEDIFPFDERNTFTKFCSKMIIEYINIF